MSTELKPLNHERRACRAAIIQALYFHFHQRNKDICALMNVQPYTVSGLTVSHTLESLPWHERRHKLLAILKAEMLLRERVQ